MQPDPSVTSEGALFIRTSAHYLEGVYLPRIAAACALLSDEDVWWRPHDSTTSVGNLLLHLAGNVRQWLISGLGGTLDTRVRSREFAPLDHPKKSQLLERLDKTVLEASSTLRGLDARHLSGKCTIQGFDTTMLEAIYHVVEHFSWHTGQIVSLAKQRAGASHGLAFYDDAKINTLRNDRAP